MPENPVTDPITDKEIAFANLILSGTMNDRRAAKAAGLHPASAAHIKAKPSVRAYLLQHRAAAEENRVEQQAEGLRAFSLGREQILTRLWELANLPAEATKGTIGGQIKAMQMIVAIENLIPDRRQIAAVVRKEAEAQAEAEAKAEAATKAKAQQSTFYVSAWMREQQAQQLAAQQAEEQAEEQAAASHAEDSACSEVPKFEASNPTTLVILTGAHPDFLPRGM